MKLVRLICYLMLLLGILPNANAQMVVGNDTLYGNEWINYGQSYFKIKIAQEGIYRLDYNALNNVGVFGGGTVPQGQNFQLFRNGQLVKMFVSNTGTLGINDFIAFYGERNRGEIDRFLYDDPNYQLNPQHSLFTDTAIYFLTWDLNTVNPNLIEPTPNDLNNLPPKESYLWAIQKSVLSSRLGLGIDRGGSGHISAKYDLGEGYSFGSFTSDQTRNISLASKVASGPDAQFEVQIMTEAGNHALEVRINNISYQSDTFVNWAVRNYKINVPISATAATTPIRILGNDPTNDRFRFVYLQARYPRITNLGGATQFVFEADSSWQKKYYEFTNFSTGGAAPLLYDFTNGLVIETQLSGSTIRATIPPSATSRLLVLINPTAYFNADLTPTTFTAFDPNQGGNYLMLTHSRLFDDGNGNNYVQDYADYRASAAGGSYTPVIVDIQQVYEQFGYGIQRHEQAIRNFVQWAYKHWQSEYLFLIGKGVYYDKYRTNPSEQAIFDLVPSFGYPTSDNLLAAKPNTDVPIMAVGRIAAYTPDMLRIYLEKVKESELAYQTAPQTLEGRAWMKNFLHLGGGDPNIQDFIKDRLIDMENTIETSKLSANVLSYFKNSTNAVQNANSEDVANRINEGVAWLTFFGHSAPNTLDFDIGDPNQYDNQGKYPMIYAMGCNTNRLFETSSTLSESYVFVEDRGAIGFLGSTATTSLSNLNEYGKVLYQNLGNDFHGETIGNLVKETVNEYPLGGFWGALVKHNMLLHADPAMRIYPQPGADLLVNQPQSKVEPNLVNVQADSFAVNLKIANIGVSTADSFNVLIEQQFPDGTKATLKTVRLKLSEFQASYKIWLPFENKNSIGRNELQLTIDADDEVAEMPSMAENNNFTVLPFSVISNNATPVSPCPYSIVSEANVTLKASTANILSTPIKYYLEIDTTTLFSSPLRQSNIKESNGGLMEWRPTLTLQDSTVYYWRVSLDSTLTNGLGFDWQTSSFIYIPQSSAGWNQSHFYQTVENEYNTLINQEDKRVIDFAVKTVEARAQNGAFPNISWTEVGLDLNGFRSATFWPSCGYVDGINAIILDPIKLSMKRNLPTVGNVTPNCSGNPAFRYMFNPATIAERQHFINFLDTIPTGTYVVIFAIKNATGTLNATQWAADSTTLGTNIFQVLEAQGATKIRDMENTEMPYILIYRKDDPSWSGFREMKASSNIEIMQATTILTGKQTNGSITSTAVGPAQSWGDLSWSVSDFDPLSDTVSLDLIGVTQGGTDTLLMSGITSYNLSLDFVPAAVYPYLKLRYHVKDVQNLTPAQLSHWRVLYTPLPDAALHPEKHLVFYKDTLQQGDDFKFEVAVQNVSSTPMDSLLVKYTVTNATNQATETYIRNAPLQGDSSLYATFNFSTRDLLGKQFISIEVNPNQDQPERYAFNNVGTAQFYVTKDQSPPLLDVTFDGVHIMSGDLVSPKPNVLITLKDENPFFALSDTSTFTLYVRYPNGTLKRFYIDNQTVIFRPADGNNLGAANKAEIEFLPEFTDDGIYQLQINAKDASNNLAGANQYKIDFEVITKATVSNVLNYPNPFSTATQFVFTLTGNELPEAMNIQIMTVSGKIVKTITKEDLGDIRIGQNRTDYQWDGTDDFGSPLANGVYLYRVNLKSSTDEVYEKFNTNTDDYFKNGFGKMVILR